MIWQFIVSFFCALFGTCDEGHCRTLVHANVDHMICSFATEAISVRLYLKNSEGKPYASLSQLERSIDKPVLMLMNGGMYHDDLGAVGLHVEGGIESQAISTKGGWGNFHLLPNGVFWGKGGKLGVTETGAYIRQKIKPDFATQSGPMLVINGKLHPRFLKNSDSRKIRNGVGISRDGKTVHFVISKDSITFWDFGSLFRDQLKAHNALFLDGTVSAIRSPGYQQGGWRDLGPMIAVFEK